MLLIPQEVDKALNRIKPYIYNTPLVQSSLLNKLLGHEIYFKLENFQKTAAFKARGAINNLLALEEQGKLPKEIVAFTSGNHGQAISWAANKFGIKTFLYVPSFVSKVKQNAMHGYGATVINTETRKEAEDLAYEHAASGGYFIHPSSSELSVLGYGTACLEVLQQNVIPDAIFLPCGGGGLITGTYLATKLVQQNIKVFGVEPRNANDAVMSLKNGKIFKFTESPNTIADGLRTLEIYENIFEYLKKIDGIYEVDETEIIYWTQWISHLLKIVCEPSSAASLPAMIKWLKEQTAPKKILIIISGGNVDQVTNQKIWANNYLEVLPNLTNII